MQTRNARLRELRAYAAASLMLSTQCRIPAVRTMMQQDAAEYMVDWWIETRSF